MSTAILLTGDPGSGKTTLIQRVVARIDIPIGGFYTQEIREGGVRQGFKIITFDEQEGILAHIKHPGPPRVGKYGVNLSALETVAVGSLLRTLQTPSLIVIDEIGPMEMFSRRFCQTVLDILNMDRVILGSIVKRSKPFSDQIKARPDVKMIEVRPDNRDLLLEIVLDLLSTARLHKMT